MAKELTQTELVFSVLKELGTGSYTTRDIMSAMTKEELDRLKHDSKIVSKLLQNLEKSGRIKQAEKMRMGSITVSKWQVTNNKVSTDKPVVSTEAIAVLEEMLKQDTELLNAGIPEEKQKPEQKSFSFTGVKADTIESLIEYAQNTAILSVASIFSALIEQTHALPARAEIADLDKKLKMLDDLSRTFSGSDYAALCTEIKADLESK
jgi:hypothetical protein